MTLKRIYIAGNGAKVGCEAAVARACAVLKDKAQVVGVGLERDTPLPTEALDLVLSLGGDGTLLNLVPELAERGIPVMGVNFGRLGFLTAGLADELEELLETWLAGGMDTLARMLLHIEVQHKEGQTRSFRGLNDAVICTRHLGRIITIDTWAAGERLFKLRADGVIVATPTGSTAHSLSCGGALVHPRVESFQLTPMGAQSMSSRPVMVSGKDDIELELCEGRAVLLVDGRDRTELNPTDRIYIRRSDRRVQLLVKSGFKFYKRLREKLGWSREMGL